MDRRRKFLFTGPTGVGKTTAIALISDDEPVATEMAASGELAATKTTTTTALDFGQVRLDDGEVIGLYGTPGQERFDYMWTLLQERAMGLVILLDHSRPGSLTDLQRYLDGFGELIAQTGAVIGLTRADSEAGPAIDAYHECVAEYGYMLPVIECDIRRAEDVRLLMEAVISMAEPLADDQGALPEENES